MTYFNQPPSAEQVLKALVEQPAKLARQLTGGNLEVIGSLLDECSALTWPQILPTVCLSLSSTELLCCRSCVCRRWLLLSMWCRRPFSESYQATGLTSSLL